jgi:hypothetical protein
MQGAPQDMALSSLLHRIFVCVTFGWNVEKLEYLQQTVSTVLQYPTHVDVCVVTNDEAALANVLLQWDLGSVWVCKTERDDADPNRYALLFEHRHAIQKAFLGERNVTHPIDHALPEKPTKIWCACVPQAS